jgi:hypothetical protein
LSDIPLPLLERAARQLIHTSTFFPRIAELRQAAAQLAGTVFFSSALPPTLDSFALQAKQLEDDYFRHGEFDLQDWEKLALQLEVVDRIHRAAELRQKASHIQEYLSARQCGEEYPSSQARLRYAEWKDYTSAIQLD